MKVPVLKKYINKKEAFVERRMPSPGKIQVKVGDTVNSYDKIGEATFVKEEKKCEFSGEITKKVGDKVSSGEVIAVDKKMIFRKKEYKSPLNGRVKEINEEKNYMIVQGPTDHFPLISGVTGEVKDTLNKQSVLIKTSASIIKAVSGTGNEVGGEILFIKDEGVVNDEDITDSVSGKVLVADNITKSAIQKAITLGCVGFVMGGIDYVEYKKFIQEDISILVLEGFGDIGINPYLKKYLKNIDSRFALIRTYDKELIVPTDPKDPKFLFDSEVEEELEKDLKEGDWIQIFTKDNFCKVAKVLEINEKEETFKVKIDDKEVSLKSGSVGVIG